MENEKTGKESNEVIERWHKKMPRFFYWMVVAACGVGGMAFTINSSIPSLGGVLPEWWTNVYTHILTACVCVIFVCKFTVAGGYKKIDPDRYLSDKDTEHS